jgi:hypothetical protein
MTKSSSGLAFYSRATDIEEKSIETVATTKTEQKNMILIMVIVSLTSELGSVSEFQPKTKPHRMCHGGRAV